MLSRAQTQILTGAFTKSVQNVSYYYYLGCFSLCETMDMWRESVRKVSTA